VCWDGILVDRLCLQNCEMRWTRLLSVDTRSLLRDSHQIPTSSKDLARTYCIPMIVNLKRAPMYGRTNRMREHDIVVGKVVVRGGCKCFGITPNRITSPYATVSGRYRVLHMILQFNFRKVCLYSFAYARKRMSPLSRTPSDLINKRL
jgi:hypothetical protein